MTNLQTIDAVELSQEELNHVEGGFLFLGLAVIGIVGSVVGGIIKSVSKPLYGVPCTPPAPSYCPPPAPKPYCPTR